MKDACKSNRIIDYYSMPGGSKHKLYLGLIFASGYNSLSFDHLMVTWCLNVEQGSAVRIEWLWIFHKKMLFYIV